MTKENDNIISIPSASKSSSGRPTKASSTSKYIPPLTSSNPSESFALPSNEQIIADFRACGGSLAAFLKAHIADENQRKACAVAAIEQLKEDKNAWTEFEKIRIAAEKVEALLAKDELVALTKTKHPAQVQALKEVKAFTKDHPEDKTLDPIDQHLEGIEE